jgi:hypothetical protein
MLKKLEQKIKRIEKTIKYGERINLLYDGEVISEYEFIEWSIDSKTPFEWLRLCLCFDINAKGRDINKVTLKYNKVTNHQVGNCRITLI